MEFVRFTNLCAQSKQDLAARNALWGELYDAFYKRLCAFARGRMLSPLRKGEAHDFAADALARIVELCHMVNSNVYSVLCSEVRNRIVDEARRDKRFAAEVQVDDGLEPSSEDEGAQVVSGYVDQLQSLGPESGLDDDPLHDPHQHNPLHIVMRQDSMHKLQQSISSLRRTLEEHQGKSRSAYYMLALLEYHYYGGMGLKELAESLSAKLEAKGEKAVSYGNLRNVNMTLVSRLRECMQEPALASQGERV